jgi:hypothetical protein
MGLRVSLRSFVSDDNQSTTRIRTLARVSHAPGAMRKVPPIVLAAMVVGCSSSSTLEQDDLDDLDQLNELANGKADGTGDWVSVGLGVAYHRVNAGNAVLIAYGGYSARLNYSGAWASELVDQKLGAVDVGHVYAVKGPADPGYDAREIANTKLRAHLKEHANTGAPIYVVAHSSGSYVAHEMLGQLDAHADTATLARIAYADLDGGGSGLSDDIVAALAKIEFVYARDPTLSSGLSKNSSTAMALADAYAPIATAFEVTVPSTGCNSGAGWCLHDVLITHRPHNPSTFDLSRDYTDFVDRPVTIEYLEPLVATPQ